MSTLKISGITNKLSQLGDNDLLLVAQKKQDSEGYTTASIAGSLVKSGGGTSTCNFSEEKITDALSQYNAATKTDIQDLTTINEKVSKIEERVVSETAKENASFIMCDAETKYYVSGASALVSGGSKDITISKDSRFTLYALFGQSVNLKDTVVVYVNVYNKLTDSYQRIASVEFWSNDSAIFCINKQRTFDFKAGTKIRLNYSSANGSYLYSFITYDITPFWYATDLKYLSDAKLTLSPSTYSYNNYDSTIKAGDKVKPEPTLIYGSTTLTKGTDYTITYEGNTLPSLYPKSETFNYSIVTSGIITANAICKAKSSDYSGTKQTTFNIKWRWYGIAIGVYASYTTSSTTYVNRYILTYIDKKTLETNYVGPFRITATGGYDMQDMGDDTHQYLSYGNGQYGNKTLKIVDANGTVVLEQSFTVINPKG